MINFISGGSTLENIVEEQYYLAKRAGISILESSLLPDFEREAYINLVLRDLKKEQEARNIT